MADNTGFLEMLGSMIVGIIVLVYIAHYWKQILIFLGVAALVLGIIFREEVLGWLGEHPFVSFIAIVVGAALLLFLLGKLMLFLFKKIRLWLKSLANDAHRRAMLAKIQVKQGDYLSANAAFESYLSPESRYFNAQKLKRWREQHAGLYETTSFATPQKLRLSVEGQKLAETFLRYHADGEKIRKKHNKAFLANELAECSAMFDDIEGRSLDPQQRVAVITSEDNNLVIAGAGSGKTSTIVGRVRYLTGRCGVDPHHILVLSFTNKSAGELRQRLGPGPEVSTFHKLGKNILEEGVGLKSRVYDEANPQDDLRAIWGQALAGDGFLDAFRRFIFLYPKPYRDVISAGSVRELVRRNRLGGSAAVRLLPLGNKRLRSQEETKIYNYLAMHQVEFRYEEPYEHHTADRYHSQYMPDFSLYQDGKRFYLEHFGIDRRGNTGPNIDRDKYHKDMEWKRDLHRTHGTRLIETYSYEIGSAGFEKILHDKLTKAGIALRPLSREQLKQAVEEDGKDNFKEFLRLMEAFITLYKSNCITPEDLEARFAETQNDSDLIRNAIFHTMFLRMLAGYDELLKRKKCIDYGDMILKAVHTIESVKYAPHYSHVIVDEFQDMSLGRYRLLRAIRDANPGCILYGVGDDWQSIYRFTGSDISLLNRFSDHFGVTQTSKIETTYRFADPLMGLASGFVTANPQQIRKKLVSADPTRKTLVHLHYYNAAESQDSGNQEPLEPVCRTAADAFLQILDDIASDRASRGQSIMVLGRYNHDIKPLLGPGMSIPEGEEDTVIRSRQHPGLELRYLTVHKAKGLEADIVILANCSSGYYGFPSEVADDPLLAKLMAEPDKMEYAEERRLFYVAMTRAQRALHLIINTSTPSPFIYEIGQAEGPVQGSCPVCIEGRRVLRTSGNGSRFWGCSNFTYGCRWTQKYYASEEREPDDLIPTPYAVDQ